MPRRISQRPGRPSGMRARPPMPTTTSRRRARDSDMEWGERSNELRIGDCRLTTDDWEYQTRPRLDRDLAGSQAVALEFLSAGLRIHREERIELRGDHDPEPVACQKAIGRHQ